MCCQVKKKTNLEVIRVCGKATTKRMFGYWLEKLKVGDF